MSQPPVARIGGVLSADIAVPEHEREVRFYTRVLTTGENPLWADDLMNNLGMPIIGLGALNEEYAHLPLQWMPHIQVEDVAESVRRALELGGSELMHHRDGEGRSQWAVLLDPGGAAFGIIPVVPAEHLPPADPAGSSGGATLAGHVAGLDLTVADAAASQAFYRQVVGWSVRGVPAEGGDRADGAYEMLGGDGNPAAEIRHAGGAYAALPPVWMIHLPVGDLAESLRRVREEGGTILAEFPGRDGGTASAAIRDPVGAALTLIAG